VRVRLHLFDIITIIHGYEKQFFEIADVSAGYEIEGHLTFCLECCHEDCYKFTNASENKVPLSTGYKVFQVSNKRTLYAAQIHFSHFNLVPNRCLLPNSSLRLSGKDIDTLPVSWFFL